VIECQLPSVVDPTVAPEGKHLMSMFIQYAPYELHDGSWDEDRRDAFADRCFEVVNDYARTSRAPSSTARCSRRPTSSASST
jgi:phytoene dehydrogenase-like protein